MDNTIAEIIKSRIKDIKREKINVALLIFFIRFIISAILILLFKFFNINIKNSAVNDKRIKYKIVSIRKMNDLTKKLLEIDNIVDIEIILYTPKEMEIKIYIILSGRYLAEAKSNKKKKIR
ncbi:hypothetical protein YN1_7510 [Nanoarchaeota archaeon]